MAPAFSWYLALRYLLARRVNAMGVAGVAIAVWALIVVIAVFSGFISEIRGHIRGATADLVLTGVDRGTDYEAVRAVLESDDGVLSTAPRLSHYALLFPRDHLLRRFTVQHTAPTANSASQLDFVHLVGVDPGRELETTGFAGWLALQADDRAPQKPDFAVADPADPFAVPTAAYRRALALVGKPTARVLSTPPGLLLSFRRLDESRSALLFQRLAHLVTARLAGSGEDQRVVRIQREIMVPAAFETRYRTFDSNHGFVHIDFLREVLGHDPDDPSAVAAVSEVVIKARPGVDLAALRDRLAAAAAPRFGGVVQTWEEQNRTFLDAVDHERAMMKVVLFCVMLVAAFLIYATLHMMVTQKTKDIGILTSLGATPRGIAAIFLLGGGAVAALGCGLGAVLGYFSARHLNDFNDWLVANTGLAIFPTDLYDLERIPYRIEGAWLTQVLVAAFVLSLAVSYLPARRAARMDPVKALSYE